MPTIEDKEFGTVTIRKTSSSNTMKASIAPNGTLRISVPAYAPLFMVKRMIASSRVDLRRLLSSRPSLHLVDGMQIGKSHTLVVRTGSLRSIKRVANQLIITLGAHDRLENSDIISDAKTHLIAILRREAKHHLPMRIRHLASVYGFSYSSLRFTHASSRWGSCNSKQAISLNIALMNVPFELIDYVLIHELAHTKHLNHSKEFWQEVSKADPSYLLHRKQLKQYDPGV